MELKKTLKKNAFIIVATAIILLWNIGSFYITAYQGVDIFNPSTNNIPRIGNPSNINQIITPPLGNGTTLPNATTLFSLIVFNLPIEITIIFLAEMLLGAIIKTDKKRITFLRLLLLLGSAAILTIGTSTIHYFMVWPALHDWPIHAGHTFNQTSGGESIVVPLYGGAETFFTKGVTVLIFMVAMIIIVGIHFPFYKFLLKMNLTTSLTGLVIPAIYYLTIWITLSRQLTIANYESRTSSQFTLSLLMAFGFIGLSLAMLIWRYTLTLGTKPKTESPELKYIASSSEE